MLLFIAEMSLINTPPPQEKENSYNCMMTMIYIYLRVALLVKPKATQRRFRQNMALTYQHSADQKWAFTIAS